MYYLTIFESEMQYRSSSLRMFFRMAALKNSECPRGESAADTFLVKLHAKDLQFFTKASLINIFKNLLLNKYKQENLQIISQQFCCRDLKLAGFSYFLFEINHL